MICIPVTAQHHEEAMKQVERIVSLADVIELRMDLITDTTLSSLVERCRSFSRRIKILVTNRRKDHGIHESEDDGRQRIAMLKEAFVLGVDYVDVELDTPEYLRKELMSLIHTYGKRTELIISHHDFLGTPSRTHLKSLFHRCVLTGARIIKIVTMAKTPEDNLKVLELIPLAKRHGYEIITFCMGEKGRVSRIMAPLLGAYMSFASLSRGSESAPGQLTIFEMKGIVGAIEGAGAPEYYRPISPETKLFALFGNPVSHSLSPLMHNAAFAVMGVDGRYMAFCIDDPESAVRGMKGMNIRGASVTIPWKRAIMAYLDYVDDVANRIGSVNTIVNDNGILKGYNTDWLGFVRSLEEFMEIEGKVYAIIGAGGTARAALFGIVKAGGSPIILSRNVAQGETLAKEWGCAFVPLSDIETVKADCLVNTTPVGMAPKVMESPVEKRVLSRYRYVVDVIYNPLKTRLLRDAEQEGCTVVSGLSMFVHQGAEQIKLWTGQEPPRMYMKHVVEQYLVRGN